MNSNITRTTRLSNLTKALEDHKKSTKPMIMKDGRIGQPNIGGLRQKKSSKLDSYGVYVAQFLVLKNGEFVWNKEQTIKVVNDDGSIREMAHPDSAGSFDSLHERIAADIFAPQGTSRERKDQAEQNEHVVKSGIRTLINWYSDQFGLPCFCVGDATTMAPVALTIYPDTEVDEFGTTAESILETRQKKMLKGQTSNTFHKLEQLHGTEQAKLLVEKTVMEADMTPRKPLRSAAGQLELLDEG